MGDESNATAGGVCEGRQRNAEQRAHRCAQRFRAGRVRAPVGEGDERRAQCIGGADESADVAGIADVPERQPDLREGRLWEGVTPEDADHAGRMPKRRDLAEELRLNVIPRDQELDRLDPCIERGFDEIFSLRREESELVAPAAVVQLADELELLVLAGSDQAIRRAC
jgi:hypothetical protein